MRLFRWLDATTRAPGFGDRSVLAIAVAVVILSVVLRPGAGAVSLFGWEVPILCTFRRVTGVPCPGCGLTRSFVFLAHGQVLDAFRANLLGPLAFGVTVAQVPYRLRRLRRLSARAGSVGEVTSRAEEGAW